MLGSWCLLRETETLTKTPGDVHCAILDEKVVQGQVHPFQLKFDIIACSSDKHLFFFNFIEGEARS